MRKEIPYQEVIPLNKGVAVVSGSSYLIDKLQVKLYDDDGGASTKCTYDNRGICIFKDLSNNKNYTIKIRRTDLKGMLKYKNLIVKVTPLKNGAKYFVLVGASVGKGWKFEKLPVRRNVGPDIVLGNRTRYDFDKSRAIEALVNLPIPVSGVIIKECAAYFPRDPVASKKSIKEWVDKLRLHDISPILATVVPVTKDHDKKTPGRFDSILKFNDFIRDYASKEGISVLDLEKALRISDKDRHLKDEFANSDGLHLVKKAYDEALDNIVLPLIKDIKARITERQ